MTREDLKNTPWKANQRKIYPYGWEVKDKDGWTISSMVTETTAKAIASLPDTLAELELEKYHRRQDKKLAETLHADLKLSNQIHRKLEFELEKVKAENERLKKRLSVAIDFIHSLAAGFPMSFWSRTQRAGEVLKEINP